MQHLTANKPKALVPVENLPMLFHLFRRFPDKRFIVIGDYKADVLREYLACFAEVEYLFVQATGGGTCGGVSQGLELVPAGQPFMLVWSDLVLPWTFELPAGPGNYVGISQTFPCRWSYEGGVFVERNSDRHGVAGLFIFDDKSILSGLPDDGELVKWLAGRDLQFQELGLSGTREFGVLAEYEALPEEKSRPFNKLSIDGDTVTKESLDAQGDELARLESQWYAFAKSRGVKDIPVIHSTSPLKLERIQGRNIHECADIPMADKRAVLGRIVSALKDLHNLDQRPVDHFSMHEAYFGKTMTRLAKIRDLVPHASDRTIRVNGRECRNIYYYARDLERKLEALPCDHFSLIHGDCTFSNLMLRNDSTPVMIDPRGYFGFTEIFGDPNYDWAKLYYSVVGNYDRFNLKDFRLTIPANGADVRIGSNGWEALEDDFFALSNTDRETIRTIHAIIWLSLTTYAWQDYDSICGAFYNGLYYLEEVL